jgi:hypothetical protein
LGFLPGKEETARDVHEEAFNDFYRFMEGDSRKGVSTANMFYFLSAVKGLEIPERLVNGLERYPGER